MVKCVGVSNPFKVEATIEPNKPTGEAQEQFCQWRMYVKIVLAKNIVSCEFAKMNLIEALLKMLQHVESTKRVNMAS
jgi:hypothetical protein